MKTRTLLILAAFLLGMAGVVPAGWASQTEAADEVALETVTVTAEKREAPAREIPAGISVVSDTTLEDYSINTIMDVVPLIPNLYITNTGNAMITNFASLRGITGGMTGIPAVGLYVDDVYYTGLDLSLFDVERVEVLRGPQGTLYGRNSEAGIINVITKKPSGTWEGQVGVTAGSYNRMGGKGSVSGPVVPDKLFFRTAVNYIESDGYMTNKANGADDAGRLENLDGRIALSARPSDRLDLDLSYTVQRYNSPKYANFAPLHGGDLADNISVDYEGSASKDGDGAAFKVEYQMDNMKLVSVTSARQEDADGSNDIDFTTADLSTLSLRKNLDTFAQEFRLISDREDARVTWLAGLFGLHEDDDRLYGTYMNFANMGMGVPGETLSQDSNTETSGFALFGEATVGLPADLALTAGLRYDREEKDFTYTQTGGTVLTSMGYADTSGTADASFDAWLPKLSLRYRGSEDLMPYATVSRGFRSGGFNDNQNIGTAYKPEYTWNYEIGLKTRWLDNRLQVDMALFYIDWSDMQVEVVASDGTSVYIENAGSATSKGAEIEARIRPVKGLDLHMGAACSDAVYDDYKSGSNVYDGKRVIDVPGYTLNAGGTFRFDSGFFLNAGYTYYGKLYFDTDNTEAQADYGLLNAKVGYEAAGYEIYLFGTNLLDEAYVTRAFEVSSTWYGRAGAPLEGGIMVARRF